MNLLNSLLKTNDSDFTALVLRVVLGGVIFAHGAQKLFGVWGGHGFSKTIEEWEKYFQLPSYLTFIVIMIESAGAIMLISGLLTRLMAGLIGCVMLGAIIMLHAKIGFYMNWHGNQMGEGFEYHLLVLAIVISLVLQGGGKFSLDSFFLNIKN